MASDPANPVNAFRCEQGDWPALLARARALPVMQALGHDVPDSELHLLLQAPVTLAWWLATFEPHLLARNRRDVMIMGMPGGRSWVDCGRPYRLLPLLLDRPELEIAVTVLVGNSE